MTPNSKPLRFFVLVHLNMLQTIQTNKQTGIVKTKLIKCSPPLNVIMNATINVTTDKPNSIDTICINLSIQNLPSVILHSLHQWYPKAKAFTTIYSENYGKINFVLILMNAFCTNVVYQI